MADEQPKHTFLEKFNLPFSTLWAQYKIFFIVFGVLLLIVKFREVIIDILVSSAHNTVDEARKQDASLKADENKANTQADDLRKQAEDLAKNKPRVGEEWNKK